MKNYYLLMLVVPVLLMQACEKSSTNREDYGKPYQLENVHDYYVNAGEAKTFTVRLSLSDPLNKGTSFKIAPYGMPEGITVSPSSVTVHNSDSFSFYFSSTAATHDGIYRIQLNCTSPDRASSNYDFNIGVQTNCASSITGHWNVYDSGSVLMVPSHYTAWVSTNYDSNKVTLELVGRNPICELRCSDGTLTSETYYGTGSTFSAGTGTFSSNRIVLNCMIYSVPNNIYLTTIMTR